MDNQVNYGKSTTEFKVGDRVRVWSLQSFHGGGFLHGEPGFIRQDQTGDSVFVCLFRNIGGKRTFDDAYEVYVEQIRAVDKCEWCAPKDLRRLRKLAMGNMLFKGQY